ncbi:VPS10 domain-containing receptor SorCS2 [Elysia marginata]|uniref:VPS10 domain-containing receptor SorCS2 n=1 Tax=Elysia marginata TaxID=1093978 RepID=A0AAV4FMQ8_9GAST|nr:VPS10 domain-containing receptor SorCS2 [Elysia marginata]
MMAMAKDLNLVFASISLVVIVCGLFPVQVNCELLPFNAKHSKDNKAHPKQLRLSRSTSSLNGLSTAKGIFKQRSRLHIRSASPPKAVSEDSKIAINSFDFTKTKNADHVIINTVGENSMEKTFILMVNFDFAKGWPVKVEESVLWCSEDHGESFQMTNLTQNSKISFMHTFPSNRNKIVFTDEENKMIYTTEDGLDHNSSHSVPINPELVLPHPTNDNKLLIYSYTEQKLYASEDFGISWTLVAESVITPIYWGDPDFDQSEDIVHLQIEGGIPSQASYRACRLPGCQPVSGDLERVGLFMAGTLMVQKEYMFVQKENQNGSESFLMVSYNRTHFSRARFPSNERTINFLITNLDDNQVFVAVHHGNTVNLYLSDVTGQYYTLSLEDIFYEEKLDWFEIDFAEVKGMNWTFMANKIEKSDSSKPGFVQTYVSYDKGGNWAPLFINKSCSEVETCALLLELKNPDDPVRSVDTAPGIILAHGILANSHQKGLTSVFVTNDGGATWTQAPFNITCLFRILNHGSLLTAIPDSSSSNVIHYTLDQGKNWKSQKFDDHGLSYIASSSVEEKDGALIQTILGKEKIKRSWKYIKLNMTSLLPEKCEEKDYETWSLKDYNAGDSTDKCILGRVVQFMKRKAEAVCYIGETSNLHVANNSACFCTNEDYECDFGYEKAGNACHKASWYDDSFVPIACDSGGEYMKSQGYRKIIADVCIENEEDKKKYDKKKTACPSAVPMGLFLMAEMKTIPLGKEITFSLEQDRGSKWDTKYTWDFGDTSDTVSDTGFKNASQKQHAFQSSGKFNITVTATNQKGIAKASFAVEVQDTLTKLSIFAPWASVVGHDVRIGTLPRSKVQVFYRDKLHYMWSFGDEAPNSLPLLSWNSTMTHAYAKAGTYNIKIEASNSISSVSEEFPVKIFESATILELELEGTSPYLLLDSPLTVSISMQSLRHQVAQDLGLERDRLAAVGSDEYSIAYLYLFPTQRANEMSVTEIKGLIINQTNKGQLGFDPFGTHSNSNNLIKIVSAKEISGPPNTKPKTEDKKSGPNMKPVYIAVPVLAVLLIGLSVIGVVIYRKKRRGGTRYSLFESHDESDTMLDDDDVAPLNMNLEISGGGHVMDDSLIDSGGNCLVMEHGQGTSGNEEIC